MSQQKLLGVSIPIQSKSKVREQIKKCLTESSKFVHVVSLNPENIVVAGENEKFLKTLNEAEVRIIDGIGIVKAAQTLNIPVGERYSGVDLMEDLLNEPLISPLRVLFIGGKGNLAEELAVCYKANQARSKSKVQFRGLQGIRDIMSPTLEEESNIHSIVVDYMPHIVFVAFGSPYQELWLDANKEYFKATVCMGVGGGFDFLSGRISRAPKIIRGLGLEWLYRLIRQPYRVRRQMRLIKFVYLVVNQKLRSLSIVH